MRIASGSALFAACLVVASSANGKSEDDSVTLPQKGGRRAASLGTRKKRGLYGDLSIDGATENVEIRKVTPVLDRLPSRPESKGMESTSDRPSELLEDPFYKSTGNLSVSLKDSCTGSAPPTSLSKHPSTTRTQVRSNQPAFPSDHCSLEPSAHVHVYPPLYAGPPNTPFMGSEAFFLANPPHSRALAHCSTSLSIWCSEDQKSMTLVDLPETYAKSLTPDHDHLSCRARLAGEAVMSPSIDRGGRNEGYDGANSFVGTHIADGGWVSNLVQTLSS